MNFPKVSVLIPCYNAEKWLAATLDSVFSQTWNNIETVVVNDGSTDSSRAILSAYENRGVKVVDQPNRGQTAALNAALAHATGDFIQYLDADDLLAPDKIELQLRQLEANAGCISFAEWARFYDDPLQADFSPRVEWQDLDPVDWLVLNWREGGGMMYPAMWLLPIDIVRSIGPWDESLSLINDTDYFTRAVLAARQVLFCQGARTYYRSGILGSLSGSRSAAAWLSQNKTLEKCEGYLLAKENSERTRRACAMLWQRFAYSCYPYERRLSNAAASRAARLSPARLPHEGGLVYRLMCHFFGWRVARLAQKLAGRK